MYPYPQHGLAGFSDGFSLYGLKLMVHRRCGQRHQLQSLMDCTVQIHLPHTKEKYHLQANIILNFAGPSILQGLPMSLSAESLNLRHKRKATERAENNGDPLVAKKKAREASRTNKAATSTMSSAAELAPAVNHSVALTRKGSNVSAYCFGDWNINNTIFS